jgi:hypothetical protein
VHHVQDNILGAEVVPFSERDKQLDLPQGNRLSISNTIERHQWEQLAFPNPRLVEHLRGEEAQTLSPINEVSSHPEVADRGGSQPRGGCRPPPCCPGGHSGQR